MAETNSTVALDYERGPELGNLVIDETSDGVCVRVGPEAIGTWRMFRAVAAWTFVAIIATLFAGAVTNRRERVAEAAIGWGLWAILLALAAWAMWPRRHRITYLLATPLRFEFTCGDRQYELERSWIAQVVPRVSPPEFVRKHTVSIVIRLTNASEYVIWRGSLDAAEAITAALRRGLRIEPPVL